MGRRPVRRARLAAVALAMIGAGCSSSTSHSAVRTTLVPPTEPPLQAGPVGSLGGPLPTGPAPPPTTGSLGAPPSSGGSQAPGVSSTHDPATPDCPAGDLTASAATDHPKYPAGVPVGIAITVTNSGPALCQFHPALVGGGVLVQTSVGNNVWGPRPSSNAPAEYYRLSPDQGVVVLALSWDQRMCAPPCTGAEGARPTHGSYRVLPRVSNVATVKPAPFTLT